MQYTITRLNIYPVKSLGGYSLQSAEAGMRGFTYDRRWMLVDRDNRFITQRENPRMALLGIRPGNDEFEIFFKQNIFQVLGIPFSISEGKEVSVQIWDDSCIALHYNKIADEWLSEILNQSCRLVYMPDHSMRRVSHPEAKDENISFADGYPYLILGESSLQELNQRMEIPLPMNRFRPNIVFSGGQPFTEDKWENFRIGSAVFKRIKPCSRCIITTINQDTAERNKEPLQTLSDFRKTGNHIYFGQNLVLTTPGKVNVGDTITHLS